MERCKRDGTPVPLYANGPWWAWVGKWCADLAWVTCRSLYAWSDRYLDFEQ
jgi:hypothetical protein